MTSEHDELDGPEPEAVPLKRQRQRKPGEPKTKAWGTEQPRLRLGDGAKLVRMTVWLPFDVAKRVRVYCKRNRYSYTEFFTVATRKFLERLDQDAAIAALLDGQIAPEGGEGESTE